jgi:hypothetical protein
LPERVVLKTVEDELYGKASKKHAGYSSDNIRSRLPEAAEERVGGAHRKICEDQTQADHHDDECCFHPVARAACQKDRR